MYISARERKVIEALLDSRLAIPIKQIAESLDVSTRTVHRDIKGIEQVLETYGLRLIKKTGSGLVIEGKEEKIIQLKRSLYEENKIVEYTPEERQVLILSRLLESQEPVKLLTFANELGVTVATISNDLDKIENDLSGFQLQLIRKRGYGVGIQGRETNIREAISYLIMQHMNELDFLKLLQENIKDPIAPSLDHVSDHLLGLVDKEKITEIERTVETIRPALPYHLADNAYIALVIHLALAIERLQQGEFIHMEEEYLNNLKTSKEYKIATELINQLEELFNLKIPVTEIGYITMHLMGSKVRYDHEVMLEDSSLSVAFKAKQLIEFVSKELNQNLHQSDRLLNDLVVHLKPSIYRLQNQMDIQNPLKEQIYGDYPKLSAIVEQAVDQVFPQLTFPMEEKAFIVMHFASALLNLEESRGLKAIVVCASGIGTAKILAAKLKKEFHEIQEVDHQSLFDLEKLSIADYDLIVSTVSLSTIEDYVLVNPMLPTSDVHRLQHLIRKVKISKRLRDIEPAPVENDQTLQTIRQSVEEIQKYSTVVNQLLTHLHVYESKLMNGKDVLEEGCIYLQEQQVIKDVGPVLEALLEREHLGGLGIPDTSLALYHTRHENVVIPSFTILTLEKPLTMSGMDGEKMTAETLILMLAPKSIEREALETLSFLSSLLVEDPAGKGVFESKDPEHIVNYISNKLHQFFKNKLN